MTKQNNNTSAAQGGTAIRLDGEVEQEPILMASGEPEAKKLIGRLKEFNRMLVPFETAFRAATDGIGIDFNRSWLDKCLHSDYHKAIGDEFLTYLESQPKFLYATVSAEFAKQLDPLHEQVERLRRAYRKISEADHLGHSLPAALTAFEALPIGADGRMAITPEYEANLTASLDKWVRTPAEHRVYNAMRAFIDAQQELIDTLGKQGAENFLRITAQAGQSIHVLDTQRIDLEWYVNDI